MGGPQTDTRIQPIRSVILVTVIAQTGDFDCGGWLERVISRTGKPDHRATDEGAVTPHSDWWARAHEPARPQPVDIRKRETICTLRKGEDQIRLEKRDVPGHG